MSVCVFGKKFCYIVKSKKGKPIFIVQNFFKYTHSCREVFFRAAVVFMGFFKVLLYFKFSPKFLRFT